MRTIQWNDRLRRGDDFLMGFRAAHLDESVQPPLTVYDYNFTGHTGKAQLRLSADHPLVLLEFTVVIANQSLTPGLVWVSATGAQTGLLTEESGVYDVQLTSGAGATFTIAEGRIDVVPDVSRV